MNHAFEFYRNEFAKYDELATEYLTKAYYAESPFARLIALSFHDKETIESLRALIQLNIAIGDITHNDYWQKKIEKILAKYPTKKEVLLYES